MKSYRTVFLMSLAGVLACLVVSVRVSQGAVGCTLRDPDRDIRRIFPAATGYKTQFVSIKERGGDELFAEVEKKLGDKLDAVYETADVPYAYYRVLKGKEIIGRVHGVNQKGRYGGMQLILATDPDGVIVSFYFQKISSPEARKFRDKDFTAAFKGLALEDFFCFRDQKDGAGDGGKVGTIKDPTEKNAKDFAATLRGVLKNLILLDVFEFDRKYSNLYEEARRNENKSE